MFGLWVRIRDVRINIFVAFPSHSKKDLHVPSPFSIFAFSRAVLSQSIYLRLFLTLHVFFLFLSKTLSQLAHVPMPLLWPLFIRLLPLSCSLQSLPINPLWREDLSAFRDGMRCALDACLLLRGFTPHFPGFDFLSGPWARGVCSTMMEGFHCNFTAPLGSDLSLCICAVAFIDGSPSYHMAAAPLRHCFWNPRGSW